MHIAYRFTPLPLCYALSLALKPLPTEHTEEPDCFLLPQIVSCITFRPY